MLVHLSEWARTSDRIGDNSTSIEITAYRLAAYADVCRAPGVRHQNEARYHVSGSPPTHYFALHPLGPLAELARMDSLTTWEKMLESEARVWAVRISIPAPSDLLVVTPANATAALQIEPYALVDDDYHECQKAAELCRANPAMAKVWQVPSAALPGTDNLVVFGDRQGIDYDLQITDPDYEIAACVVADRGLPPFELMSLIRFKGPGPHAGFEERVRNGENSTFIQPIFNHFNVDQGTPSSGDPFTL